MSRLAQPNKAVPPIVAGVLVLALVTSLIIWNQSGPQADPKPQAKTQVDPYANLDLEQPQPSYQLLRYVADNGGDDFQRRLSIQWLADFGRLRSKPTASQESWLLSLIESGGHPDWDIETTLWLFNNTFNVLHNGKEPAGLTRQLNHLATQHPDMTMRLYALQHLEVQRNQGRLTGALADETRVMLKHHDFDDNGTTDFSRIIDRSQDTLLRNTGFQLKNGATVENQATYAYGATDGRLATVSDLNDTFTYAYQANSVNLLASVTGPVVTTTRTWEGDRNVLDTKTNSVTAGVVSSYDYSVNNFGQRTNVNTSGSAFPVNNSWGWGYNATGEVVKADSSNNAYDRAYKFDGIGNRLEAADGVTTVTGTDNYTPNALNQYSAVGTIAPAYDDDGNATAYPLPAHATANSALTYDAENRLIEADVNGTVTSFQYDGMSRRISKTTGSATTVYVYDGWNMIAEYSGVTYTLAKTFTWGMDLSGSMQGAGGVGGLLTTTDGTGTYYPTYDGNGNVSEYVDSTGVATAHFEYDPFGRAVVDTDSSAHFEFRFSTKVLDGETGLYYYGYRYYDPETGRWLSRDPIEEQGGLNLYAFVRNNGVNRIDYLGLLDDGEEFPDVQIRKKHIKWMVVKGKAEGDGYGHWWFEIDGSESYGWWPDRKVGAWDTLRGVPGDLNGLEGDFGGTETTDPHHGDAADEEYAATIDYGGFLGFNIRELEHGSGKGTKCDCAKPGEIKDCMREFATSFGGDWSHPWGNSCHDFLAQAMDACCLDD